MLWRPIKDEADDARFLGGDRGDRRAEHTAARDRHRAIAPGPHSPQPLRRTGLLFVNPPFGLYDEARDS